MNTRKINQRIINLLASSGMLAFILVGVFLTMPAVNAETTASENVSITISPSCTMRGEETSAHSTTMLGGQYKKDIGSTTLTVYCNDPQGFAIYAVGSSGGSVGNTNLLSNNGAAPIATGIATSGDTSNWGMKVTPVSGTYTMIADTFTSNSDGYYAVPSDFTRVARFETATDIEGGTSSQLNTTYFIYAAGTQPAGNYEGQVAYLMVHPYTETVKMDINTAFALSGKEQIEVNGNNYYKMQDMSTAICNMATVTGEASQTQLVDVRDNKLYWVAKLDDGHCWMTENLDFDIPTTALSSTTTDLTSYDVGGYTAANGYSKDATTGEITWTPVRSTINASSMTITDTSYSFSGWTNDYYTPYSVDVGERYVDGDAWYSSTDDCKRANGSNATSGYNCENHFKETPYATNGTHGALGNYYNWSAAVAANNTNIAPWTSSTYSNIANNPQNSICPAGWRLPTISSQANTTPNSTNEFGRLNYLYNGGRDDNDSGLFNAPIYLPRAGYTNSGEVWNGGYDGYYWSSTVYYAYDAYSLYFYSAGVVPENNYNRFNGFSVRCVAR